MLRGGVQDKEQNEDRVVEKGGSDLCSSVSCSMSPIFEAIVCSVFL
jgi:hypothetical protein